MFTKYWKTCLGMFTNQLEDLPGHVYMENWFGSVSFQLLSPPCKQESLRSFEEYFQF
jgi:hypothetical protein